MSPRALLIAGAVVLAAASAASPAVAQPGGTPTVIEQQQVRDYWTPQRMRDAVSLDQLTVHSGQRVDTVDHGAPAEVPPMSATNGGAPWTGGGAVTRTAGRIFFTFQGRDAACSGDAVTSRNKDVVLTAGHCVKYQGSWHTNWVFVPGYSGGNAPFGKWPARRLLSTPQWVANEQQSIGYDIGTGVVGTLNDKHLADVVGGQGIAFNQGRQQQMYAFGYPAQAPYDGNRLIYCSGQDSGEPLAGSGDHGLRCDMTAGASGGPWFLRFTESAGTGTQASVNSFKYSFDPNSMFGPYFGNDAKALYDQAQGA